MSDFKCFLLFASGVVILIAGLFIIINTNQCYSNRDVSCLLSLPGIVIVGIGGFLVLVSVFMTMARPTKFDQCFPQICIGQQNIIPRNNVIELSSLALSQNN